MDSPSDEKKTTSNRHEDTQFYSFSKLTKDSFRVPSTEDIPYENERYTLIKTLGEGGMGTVQLVKDSVLQREVALKRIKKESLDIRELFRKKQTTLWRIRREAEITAILEHPNIIPLYDLQTSLDGDIYFTMRKVEGETFGAILQKKLNGESILEEEDLLTIFNKICDAVSYAHSKKIIHRDLKPDNIMVGQFGEVYVMDWGIAKRLVETESEKSTVPLSQTLLIESSKEMQESETSVWDFEKNLRTVGGIGTRGYVAPEQITNASTVNEQADIYALGKILKQCFVYLSPNEELKHQLALREQIHRSRKNKAMVSQLQKLGKAEIPEDVQAIIQKATEAEWKKRYASVKELSSDLDRYRRNLQVSVRQYSLGELLGKWAKRNQKQLRGIGAFLGALIVILGSLWGYLRQEKQKRFENDMTQAKHEAKKGEQLKESEKGQQLEHYLRALNFVNNALLLKPSEAGAEEMKARLSEILVKLACETQNYHFAMYVAREVKNERDQNLKQILENHVEVARTKKLKQHQQQLKHWKEALLNPEEGVYEEAVLEISKMNEPEILQELIEIVQEGTDYFVSSQERSERKNNYYGTMVKALGYLENPEAGEVLWNGLVQISKTLLRFEESKHPKSYIDYLVLLAESLKHSRAKNYSVPFLNLTSMLGNKSNFANRTRKISTKLVLHDDASAKIQPVSAKDYANRAYLKQEVNDYEGALVDYTEAIRRDPDNDFYYFNRAHVYVCLNKRADAIADYTKVILLNPKQVDAYIQRGINLKDLGALEKAIADLTEAIRLSPENAEAYTNRGIIKKDAGDFLGAIEDHTKAITLRPQYAEAYVNRGVVKTGQENWNAAIDDYTEAIRLNSTHIIAYANRAYNKKQKGDIEGAIADFTEALRLSPQNVAYYNARGVLKDDKKDYMGAIEDFTEGLYLEPQNVILTLNRALSRTRNNDYSKAIEDFTKTLQLDPQSVYAYLYRGMCYLNLHQIDKALDDLDRAKSFKKKAVDAEVLNYYQRYELVFLNTHPEDSLKIFQKRYEFDATAKFSAPLSDVIINRMIQAYRKKEYEPFKTNLDLFEQYASPNHPKYTQIPEFRANLEKLKSK